MTARRTRIPVRARTADIDHVWVCDCSICRVRGVLIHRVPAEGEIDRGLAPFEGWAGKHRALP